MFVECSAGGLPAAHHKNHMLGVRYGKESSKESCKDSQN